MFVFLFFHTYALIEHSSANQNQDLNIFDHPTYVWLSLLSCISYLFVYHIRVPHPLASSCLLGATNFANNWRIFSFLIFAETLIVEFSRKFTSKIFFIFIKISRRLWKIVQNFRFRENSKIHFRPNSSLDHLSTYAYGE